MVQGSEDAIPEGQEDQLVDEHTQYFGTFPILDAHNQEFSVFHRLYITGIDEARDIISTTIESCDRPT